MIENHEKNQYKIRDDWHHLKSASLNLILFFIGIIFKLNAKGFKL